MADNDDINNQLLHAACNGHTDTVRDLIQRQGADPNHARDNGYGGSTPLSWAAQYGHVEVVRILGELGADPNLATTYCGTTPIFMATVHGHVEVVRALVELGADPNATLSAGETPIFWAALYSRAEVTLVLGELGADPSFPRRNGDTPIVVAARRGKLEVVHALCVLGADPTILDREVRRLLETPVPQPHREQIRAELDNTIEEVQIIELVADFVGPMCDPKRRKAYIAERAQHRAEMKKQKKQ